jgi:hypothetical protein
MDINSINQANRYTRKRVEQINEHLYSNQINVRFPPPPLVGAFGDGETSDTLNIQACLDLAERIGGYVYVPPTAKGYLIDGQLSIPNGVLLYSSPVLPFIDIARGIWTSGQGATLLFTSKTVSPITFKVTNNSAGGGGIAGFIFYYPNQTATNPPIAYPPTVFIPPNTYDFTIENIYTVNCYFFMSATSYHGRGLVKNIFGQCLYRGFEINEMRDTSIYKNIHFATIYPVGINPNVNPLGLWMKDNFIPFVVRRVDNISISKFSVYWCYRGMWFTSGNTQDAYGQLDTISVDIAKDIGIAIDGYLPNGLEFNSVMICNAAKGINLTATPTTVGAVQFNAVSMWAVKNAIHIGENSTNSKLILTNAQIGWTTETGSSAILFDGNAVSEIWLDSVCFYRYAAAGGTGTQTDISFGQADTKKCVVNVSNVHFTSGALTTWMARPNDCTVLQNGLKKLASITIGTTQTAVPHYLAFAPTKVIIVPKGNANVWQSANADATNVYLTASVSAVVDLWIGQ